MRVMTKSALAKAFGLKMDEVTEISDPWILNFANKIDYEISSEPDENVRKALIMTKDVFIRILVNNPTYLKHFKNILVETHESTPNIK